MENKLSSETSPYLQQHKDNPVYWHPWDEEIIEVARRQEKPILLSIGYSSCHWCHVMMHESFEDQETASLMNRLFINIKVDKEERPDLDKIYQTAYQVLHDRPGGWPLTMFLDPNSLLPFFGGTYFPKEPTNGMIDFKTLLEQLDDAYYQQKEQIKTQEAQLKSIFESIQASRPSTLSPIAMELINDASKRTIKHLSSEYGFGGSPKFPNCPSLELLIQSELPDAEQMIKNNLDLMAKGGIFDHISGGFFRYTVDKEWQIPHFEKMLYDNGQLISIYAHAYQQSKSEDYKKIIHHTINWLNNTMKNSSGAFYSSVDADSVTGEGGYYTWDPDSIKKILTKDEFKEIEQYYKLDKKANFNGKWHLAIEHEISQPNPEILSSAVAKLLDARSKREHPKIDKKIITSWNSLTIKGLCDAATTLEHKPFYLMANAAIEFIKQNLYKNGTLYATYKDNKLGVPGFIDDYAFLLAALIAYQQGTGKQDHKDFCNLIANKMISEFYDAENGGFYFSAHTANIDFYRPKLYTDESTPSGNGIACQSLVKLGLHLDKVKETLNNALVYLNEAPEFHATLCIAYRDFYNNQ